MTPRRVHCIFNTPCRIRCKARALFRVESRDALDESNGADGYEIVGVVGLGVVFFDDVRDETQVVFDEHIARLDIALEPEVHIFALLGGRQRPGERTG